MQERREVCTSVRRHAEREVFRRFLGGKIVVTRVKLPLRHSEAPHAVAGNDVERAGERVPERSREKAVIRSGDEDL
jgi:hypothetical protein